MLSSTWKAAMEKLIRDYQRDERNDITYRTGVTIAQQWLVLALADAGIPYRILNLGCGVKEFTTKTDTCLKCHGTGKA
jgi:hypothetical protein